MFVILYNSRSLTPTQIYKERKTDRQTDRLTDRQTDKQTDRQTDRQTNRQTDIQTERKVKTEGPKKLMSKDIHNLYYNVIIDGPSNIHNE